jgi:hypothetical protein
MFNTQCSSSGYDNFLGFNTLILIIEHWKLKIIITKTTQNPILPFLMKREGRKQNY